MAYPPIPTLDENGWFEGEKVNQGIDTRLQQKVDAAATPLVGRVEDAEQAASDAASTAATLVPRMTSVENSVGLGVGDPADATNANLISREDTETRSALNVASADTAALLRPGVNLDIWPGMNPIPSTYATWISQVDAELGGKATKKVIGQDSYGSDIHLYDTGAGRRTVLLVSGQHPWEIMGSIACRQFFIQFATSNHPAMVVLRQQIRLLWIPAVVSGDFRGGRENKNGVNTNRNYPWNWSLASGADKGAAPLDQPETQVIKSVLDTYPVSLLFDCHNFGSSSTMDLAYCTTSNAVQGKVLTMERARAAWESANPDGPTPTQYSATGEIAPTLVGWGGKYMRYDLGRYNAMTVLIECIATMGGSNPNGHVMTRDAVRWYSSFIYQTVLTWLEHGQVDDPVIPFTWLGTHNLSSGGYDVPIDTGGRRINSDTFKPVQLAFTSNGSSRNYVSVPVRHPGIYEVVATIHLEGIMPAGNTVTIEAGVSMGERGTATGPAANSVRPVQIIGNNSRQSLQVQWTAAYNTVPDESIHEAKLWLRVVNLTSGEAVIRSVSGVNMMIKPYWTGAPTYQPLASQFNA